MHWPASCVHNLAAVPLLPNSCVCFSVVLRSLALPNIIQAHCRCPISGPLLLRPGRPFCAEEGTPQCFLLTPKLLPDLPFSPDVTVLQIMNGPQIGSIARGFTPVRKSNCLRTASMLSQAAQQAAALQIGGTGADWPLTEQLRGALEYHAVLRTDMTAIGNQCQFTVCPVHSGSAV